MEFRVPQYIEVEDKIFGPFTVTQFIYLLGGAGIIVLLWKFLPTFIAILVILPVALFTWALVFFPKKKYGKPFVELVESAFKYFSSAKLYTWRKEERRKEKEVEIKEKEGADANVPLPHVSESKLHDLSWTLDVSKGTSGKEETSKDHPADNSTPDKPKQEQED